MNRSSRLDIPLLLMAALTISACQGITWLAPGIEPPALMSPPNNARLECPPAEQGQLPRFSFSWADARNARSYVLEVYRETDVTLVASIPTGATTATAELNCGLDYLWRVGAVPQSPSHGSPVWSATWRFSVNPPPNQSAMPTCRPSTPPPNPCAGTWTRDDRTCTWRCSMP